MKYQRIPVEKRNEIMREYLTSDLSYRELSEKHHIKPDTIQKWLQRHLYRENVISLPSHNKSIADMSRKKNESESAEISSLKARIRELEQQNLALNTLIDVAERNGIDIRKKSGAKQ